MLKNIYFKFHDFFKNIFNTIKNPLARDVVSRAILKKKKHIFIIISEQ